MLIRTLSHCNFRRRRNFHRIALSQSTICSTNIIAITFSDKIKSYCLKYCNRWCVRNASLFSVLSLSNFDCFWLHESSFTHCVYIRNYSSHTNSQPNHEMSNESDTLCCRFMTIKPYCRCGCELKQNKSRWIKDRHAFYATDRVIYCVNVRWQPRKMGKKNINHDTFHSWTEKMFHSLFFVVDWQKKWQQFS